MTGRYRPQRPRADRAGWEEGDTSPGPSGLQGIEDAIAAAEEIRAGDAAEARAILAELA